MFMRIKLSLLLLFFNHLLFSENIKELEEQYYKANNDSVKTTALYQLFWHYKETNPDKAFTYIQLLQQIALNGYKPAEGYMYHCYGEYFMIKGEHEKALKFYQKAEQEYSKLKKKKEHKLASISNSIGVIYQHMGDYENAILRYMQTLKYAEQMNDYELLAAACNNIAIIYFYRGMTQQSEEYFTKALNYRIKENNLNGIADSYNNIGVLNKLSGKLSKAADYYKKAAEIYEKTNNKNSLGVAYMNIGGLLLEENKIGQALDYFNKSLKIKIELDEKRGICDIYTYIARAYKKQSNYDKSLEYASKALNIATENIYDKGISESLMELTEIYKHLENHRQALYFFEKLYQHRDSMLAKQNDEAIEKIQQEYEDEKKKRIIQEQENQLNLQKIESIKKDEKIYRKNILLYATLGGIIILFGLSYALYNRYHYKKKANAELEKKNAEISKQKDIIEEKNKDITDSINYAQTIQHAILPTQEELNKISEEHFVLFMPRDIVSGDFYWAYSKDDFSVFAVADCTGHGVPGAFMSMIGINLLNKIVIDKQKRKPSEILNELNEEIKLAFKKNITDYKGRDGMDIALCVWQKTKNSLLFAGAKRPLYIVRDKKLLQIDAQPYPVGEKEYTNPFTDINIDVLPGEQLYLTSDGFADQFGGINGKKLLTKRTKELILKYADLPLSEQKKVLQTEWLNWKKGFDQVDDVCILALKI
jgi:serine phosphatase RsbU (regulator of sigma subunit)